MLMIHVLLCHQLTGVVKCTTGETLYDFKPLTVYLVSHLKVNPANNRRLIISIVITPSIPITPRAINSITTGSQTSLEMNK